MSHASSKPFTNLRCDIYKNIKRGKKVKLSPCPALAEVRERPVSFRNLPLKRVKFQHFPCSEVICPSVQLLRGILLISTLEELSVNKLWLDKVQNSWLEQLYQDGFVLPNLRSFELTQASFSNYKDFLIKLIESSPKFGNLKCYVDPKDVLPVLENKPWVIKKLTFDPVTKENEAAMEQVVKSGAKLEELRAVFSKYGTKQGVEQDVSSRTRNAFLNLISNCHESLRLLSISAYTAVKLIRAELRPFKTLKSLELDCPLHPDITYAMRPLKTLDFRVMFPKVSSVSIRGSGSHFLNANGQKNETTMHVIQLTLKGSLYRITNYSIELFPYVTSLTVTECFPDVHTFREFWRLWPKLKKFTIGETANLDRLPDFSLDAAFCGISREEAAEISKLSFPIDKDMNIVPCAHSLLNLPGEIGIEISISPGLIAFPFKHKNRSFVFLDLEEIEFVADAYNRRGLMFSISQATWALIFKRRPGLKVILNASHSLVIYGKPYIFVVTLYE